MHQLVDQLQGVYLANLLVGGERLGVARHGTRERGCSGADSCQSTSDSFEAGAAGPGVVVHAEREREREQQHRREVQVEPRQCWHPHPES